MVSERDERTSSRIEPAALERMCQYTAGCPCARELRPLVAAPNARYLLTRHPLKSRHRSHHLETHGPLATLWIGIGLCCFYIALVWLNTLLGVVLTPLFIVPLTWLQDRLGTKKVVRD